MFGITRLSPEDREAYKRSQKIKSLQADLAKEMEARRASLAKSEELQAELDKLVKL